jgi:hypothetical protein
MDSVSVILLFLFYVAAFILSWFREKTAGYMFVLWYILMMTLAFYLWTAAGMTIILGFPVLPIGAFYVLYAFNKFKDPKPPKYQQWKLVLRVLMVGYAAIFISVILGDLNNYDFLGVPYVYFPVLFIVFIAAFAFVWKNELIAGLLMVLWYFGIIAIAGYFPELPNEFGPMRLMGIPVLVQGILYLVYWNYVRPKIS